MDRKAFTTHIEFEVRKYTQQIANLISFNYRSIVGRTVNGTFPLKNREDFFKSLYTRENLEAAQFEFLPQVEGLLSSPDYVQAKRYYSRAAFLKESGAVEEGAGNL